MHFLFFLAKHNIHTLHQQQIRSLSQQKHK